MPSEDLHITPAPEPEDFESMEREVEEAAQAYEDYLSSMDSDGDTVNDLDDNCPDLAGHPECNGCSCPPVPDTDPCEGGDPDGDGWCADDACPNEYGLDNGCPLEDFFPEMYDGYHFELQEDGEWEYVGVA